MALIDANYILRYLLRDNEEQFLIVREVIENHDISVPDFILAEIVYVLEKIYKVQRNEIKSVLEDLLGYKNISVTNREIILRSLTLFTNHKIDYADALLIAYFKSGRNSKLYTFDKKILKILSSKTLES